MTEEKQRPDKKQRCKNCGVRIIKFPLWRGQEYDEPFSFDRIIWINLFKMEMDAFLLFATTLVWMFVYWHDTNMYQDIAEHPVQYCEAAGCVCGQPTPTINEAIPGDDGNQSIRPVRLPVG